jgi:hypothetical protein
MLNSLSPDQRGIADNDWLRHAGHEILEALNKPIRERMVQDNLKMLPVTMLGMKRTACANSIPTFVLTQMPR